MTFFFHEHARAFRHAAPIRGEEPLDHLRLTVDTEDDARFFERFLRRAGDDWPGWTLADMSAAAAELQASAT